MVASTDSATTLNVVAELAVVEPVETTIESVNAVGDIFCGCWLCRSIETTAGKSQRKRWLRQAQPPPLTRSLSLRLLSLSKHRNDHGEFYGRWWLRQAQPPPLMRSLNLRSLSLSKRPSNLLMRSAVFSVVVGFVEVLKRP